MKLFKKNKDLEIRKHLKDAFELAGEMISESCKDCPNFKEGCKYQDLEMVEYILSIISENNYNYLLNFIKNSSRGVTK